MSEIERTLTQKIGPLPVWAWLLIAGVSVYLIAKFLPGLLGTKSGVNTAQTPPLSTPTPTTENAGAQLSQEIGLLQQLQGYNSAAYANSLQQVQQTQGVAQQLTTPSGPSPIGSTVTVFPLPPSVVSGIFDTKDITNANFASHIIGTVPAGTQLTVAGGLQTGGTFAYNTTTPQGPSPISSNQWQPVNWSGSVGYIWAPNIRPTGATPTNSQGQPVGGRVGQAHPLFHGGHTALKTKVRMPHYAVGGPRDLATISMQTGIHPARLMAANGHLRNQNYKAAPGQVIRIA